MSSLPFSQTRETRVPVAKVRVIWVGKRLFDRWSVEYLPAGKRDWWWNWESADHFENQRDARFYADELVQRGYYSVIRYERNEYTLVRKHP